MKPHAITAVIPSIPPRTRLLQRALRSVVAQTHPAEAIAVAIDREGRGAGPTRTRAMRTVQTEWTAFLDDDDEWMPRHLEVLVQAQQESGADVIWPWFEVVGGTDPFPQHRGRQYDPADPHIWPICTLVRTELLRLTRFPPISNEPDWSGDDYPVWLDLGRLGATFHHVDQVTWTWHHHFADPVGVRNTSGHPTWLSEVAK